ncbi:MAG: methyl-accepting chemotaxis protein [Betaproteobacteria bacterium]|nr:methyl-accepting chemotaxis protein [Betaproteobacteria bacterium]
MRLNHPVTDIETLLPEGEFIYTRTDLKGQIVEANDAFVKICGFSTDEMIGQPHNMVRHPDMPPEAFEDMWRDLKVGRPWRGLVKNRCKDGGFYWVVANASPVRENGQVVGYQSVRGRPSREEVAATEAIYKRIRQGDKSVRILHGQAVPARSLKSALLSWMTNDRLQTGLIGLAILIMGSALVALAYAPSLLPPALLYILGGVGAALGLWFLLFFRARLMGDLKKTDEYLAHILGSGDLRMRALTKRNDTVGNIARQSDQMAAWIQSTLQGIEDVALAVRNSAAEVAQSVVTLNRSAQTQSDATSAAAAEIEQNTTSIGEITVCAERTKEVADEASKMSEKGSLLADQASATILQLAGTVKDSAVQVERLGEQSREISRITGVIRGIAEQTNLLALNAAIEAARAGEQGRGFAVVADEVHKLADRSVKAAEEVSQMIAAVQAETDKAVSGMRAGAEQVENSVKNVEGAKDVLQEINRHMAHMSTTVGDIFSSTRNQQAVMGQMAENIEQVARMTGQNLVQASDTSRTANDLHALTERMQKSVGQFKV